MRIISPLFFLLALALLFPRPIFAAPRATWWQVQSVDTMKYSRDLAREKLHDPAFTGLIDSQVRDIASTGATHVAIATPYDDEFLPVLRLWVTAARKYRLGVWFRGNFSGWEGWFEYPKISRDQHLAMTENFILSHPDLFRDGDIFSPCPECENGGPGDPRHNGDVTGFREFLIRLYRISSSAFTTIGKKVAANYFSLNGDVARLVMDRPTTAALDGIVVVDHYVADPQKLVSDLVSLADSSGGQVVLGEFGVPIPGIHGVMSQSQQAKWLDELLTRLIDKPQVVGLNYWTNTGSSTALWTTGGSPRPAVDTLTRYYSPPLRSVTVLNFVGRPVTAAVADFKGRKFFSNSAGTISIPIIFSDSSGIVISAPGYFDHGLQATNSAEPLTIYLVKSHENLLFKLLKLIYSLRRDIVIGQ
ncbi:hypothetical protein A3C34_02080 [Candidatus Amesbacteria bacterium RIFCSPHIGHO2_02_FULL_48_21]|nr:MAG: hypothetical protein A3C34_02080 [Candidatus Amesbacteria bacterium RIFCSPHIGHO2_02_FULL_48_21]